MRYVLIVLVLFCIYGFLPASAETIEHEVQPGETLYGIAREYGISVDQLSESNRIESPDLLLPGTILVIEKRYRIQSGDTLYGIARAHRTTVDTLRELNDLDSSTIVVGRYLRVPMESGDRKPNETDLAAVDSPGTDDTRSTTDDAGNTSERSEVVPVALTLNEPISFADGGAWPVAGSRTRMEGKLPGVLIRAERGTPVTAIASGRIVYAGPHSTFGNVVFVQSSQGYIYVYGGQERVVVDVGDSISAGTELGTVGISPSAGGAALYFTVWRDNRFVDPESAPRG